LIVNRIAKTITASSLAVLAATVNFAGAQSAFASPPAASAVGGVSLQPLHAGPGSASYFTFHAAAGSTISDAVVITNQATTPVDLAVSPVDGLTGQTSGSVYANRQDPVAKAGTWVAPSVAELSLPGQSSRTVSFTVTVPANASPGDHLAGFAVENTNPTTSSNGFAIKEILRSVIGVLVVVPGQATFVPKLSHLDIKQIGQTGIGSVTVGLGNSGLAFAKPSLRVSLKGAAGYNRSITRGLDTVLPGDSISYPFAWPDVLAKGSYDVTATLTGGGKSVSMTQTVILGTTLAGVTHPLPVSIVKQTKSGVQLWELVLVILAGALVFGGVVGTVLRRTRRSVNKQQG
jgi:hypothetical protein